MAGPVEKKEERVKAIFTHVSFAMPELPAYFDPQKPGAAALQLAAEMFGLSQTEFNPKSGGHYWGETSHGHVFEVEIRTESAHLIATKRFPQVIDIFE